MLKHGHNENMTFCTFIGHCFGHLYFNYRSPAIIFCHCDFLNSRWNDFLDAHNVFEENQEGFRAGYSTMDDIFVLYALTEIVKAFLFINGVQ